MSATSLYAKRTRKIWSVGQQTLSGYTKTGNVLLSNSHQASELILDCVITQPYTIAPTGFDVSSAFERIQLEFNGKERIGASSRSINAINLLTESATTPVLTIDPVALTASVSFSVELHLELDGSPHDFLTVLNTPNTSSLTLTTGANWVFTGGTMSTPPTTTVNVGVNDYGTEEEYSDGIMMRSLREKIVDDTKSRTAGLPIRLDGQCATRFALFQTGYIVGGIFTPADDIITNIRITIDGKTTMTTWHALKNVLARKRTFNQVGVSGFDFGDQVNEFADSGDGDVIIEYDVGNPLAQPYRIVVGHDAIRSAL